MSNVPQGGDVGRDGSDTDDVSAVPEYQQLVARFTRTTGPAYHPIFDKFEGEHVTQFLAQSHQSDDAERGLRRSGRWFKAVYVTLGVGVFIFLTVWLLPEQAELYTEIVKSACLFAAGLAGGYGLKAYQDHRSPKA